MVIEHNATTSGSYEVTGLSDGAKVVLARAADGETFGYASVSGIGPEHSFAYFTDFSDMEDQEEFSDSNWTVTGSTYYDENVVSYNGTWTGGLIFSVNPATYIYSTFHLRGDFTKVSLNVSSAGSWAGSGHHGLFLKVMDDANNNSAGIHMEYEFGNHIQVQSCKSGSWNYDVFSKSSDVECALKMSRSGNDFLLYEDDNLIYTLTIPAAPQDMKIQINASKWSVSPSQNYMVERIWVEEATIIYS
jgi:hypothetical protein